MSFLIYDGIGVKSLEAKQWWFICIVQSVAGSVVGHTSATTHDDIGQAEHTGRDVEVQLGGQHVGSSGLSANWKMKDQTGWPNA